MKNFEPRATTTTAPCPKCGGSGTYLHFGDCFLCRATGRYTPATVKPHTNCRCQPGVWCFLPGHNYDQAFPSQAKS